MKTYTKLMKSGQDERWAVGGGHLRCVGGVRLEATELEDRGSQKSEVSPEFRSQESGDGKAESRGRRAKGGHLRCVGGLRVEVGGNFTGIGQRAEGIG